MDIILQSIKSTLDSHAFNCELVEKTAQIPIDYLLVNLGSDSLGRKRTLVLRASMLHVPSPEEDSLSESGDQLLIHLFTALPFSFSEEAAPELARLLHFYNKTLDLPGFGMDEIEKSLFFRYSLTTTKTHVKQRPLIAIIGSIMLLLDALSDQVEAVAQGASAVAVLSAAVKGILGDKAA